MTTFLVVVATILGWFSVVMLGIVAFVGTLEVMVEQYTSREKWRKIVGMSLFWLGLAIASLGLWVYLTH